jgi:hypothetical protein
MLAEQALVVLNLQSYAGGRNLWGDARGDQVLECNDLN